MMIIPYFIRNLSVKKASLPYVPTDNFAALMHFIRNTEQFPLPSLQLVNKILE